MEFWTSPMLMISVMVIAIGLLLILVAFSGRMPPKVRGGLERVLSVGYPAAVGIFFAFMSWRNYSQGEQVNAIGFAVGAVIMVVLVLRAWQRARKSS